jgi:hypothetical protein
MRKPTSGISAKISSIDIMLAGTVTTHFQLASHFKCMKNRITSIAFVQETAIIQSRLMARLSPNGQNGV